MHVAGVVLSWDDMKAKMFNETKQFCSGMIHQLGGGFKYFLFSPLFVEDYPVD